jgi:Uma2 family endonuclease
MPAQPQEPLTPEQYLEIERSASFRSEYYKGRMYAMSGGSLSNARIIANLTGEFYAALANGPLLPDVE